MLPQPVQIVTVFSGGVCAASSRQVAVRDLLEFLASAESADAKRKQGMDPA